MPGQGEGEWGNWDAAARSRGGILSLALTAVGRALAVGSDRWFLWLPVFFAGGIIAYFALSNEPQPRLAAALVLGAIGICLVLWSAPLGLALAGTFLAFASGFATAKVRTEITQVPVFAHELHYVGSVGVEAHELHDKGGRGLPSWCSVRGTPTTACRSQCRRPMLPIPASARQWRSALSFSPPIEAWRLRFRAAAWFASLGARVTRRARFSP